PRQGVSGSTTGGVECTLRLGNRGGRPSVTTPRAPGLAMPAEWSPHSRCWMAWPCQTELWGERMPAARKACAEIGKAIVAYEPVTMIARPDLAAEASLHCGQGISVLPLDHDDSRIRDVAPTF